jgi:hypothetical protein
VGGTGNIQAPDGANPTVGQVGQDEDVSEQRVEVVFPAYLEKTMVMALKKAHSYEVPALICIH